VPLVRSLLLKHSLTKTCSRVCKIDNQLKKGSEWKKKKRLSDPQGVKIARQKWLDNRYEPKEIIYCLICEKKIPPKRKNATKTCSKKCGLIYQKELNRINANKIYHQKKWMVQFEDWWKEKEADIFREDRTCEQCGKSFKRKKYGSNQSLCSLGCVRARNKIRKRNHYLNNREEMIKRAIQWNRENKEKKNSYKKTWRTRKKLRLKLN
jgi:predicted nucleic acid-binding Zn ribbon protein